jgi:hypothetical protein
MPSAQLLGLEAWKYIKVSQHFHQQCPEDVLCGRVQLGALVKRAKLCLGAESWFESSCNSRENPKPGPLLTCSCSSCLCRTDDGLGPTSFFIVKQNIRFTPETYAGFPSSLNLLWFLVVHTGCFFKFKHTFTTKYRLWLSWRHGFPHTFLLPAWLMLAARLLPKT